MSETQSPKKLLLKIVAWLPLCFIIWYYAAPILLWPVYALVQVLLNGLFPHAIDSWGFLGHDFEVFTSFNSDWISPPNSQNQQGEITIQVNALKYSYGLPLLCAMTLALPGSYGPKIRSVSIGFCILIFAQTWGVCFEIIKVMIFEIGAVINQRAGSSSGKDLAQFCMQMNEVGCYPVSRNVIGLCYQLGYLILPSISPLLIWAYFNLDYLQSIAPNLQALDNSGKRKYR